MKKNQKKNKLQKILRKREEKKRNASQSDVRPRSVNYNFF